MKYISNLYVPLKKGCIFTGSMFCRDMMVESQTIQKLAE